MNIVYWVLLAFAAVMWVYMLWVVAVEPILWHYRDKRRRAADLNRTRLGLDIARHHR